MARKRTQEIGKHPEFARRIRQALDTAGLKSPEYNYKQIGSELGVSGTMVGNLVNGDKLPGLDTAINIALRTGYCVEWLLTGRGPMHPAVAPAPEAASDIQEALLRLQNLNTEGRSIVLAMIRGAAERQPE